MALGAEGVATTATAEEPGRDRPANTASRGRQGGQRAQPDCRGLCYQKMSSARMSRGETLVLVMQPAQDRSTHDLALAPGAVTVAAGRPEPTVRAPGAVARGCSARRRGEAELDRERSRELRRRDLADPPPGGASLPAPSVAHGVATRAHDAHRRLPHLRRGRGSRTDTAHRCGSRGRTGGVRLLGGAPQDCGRA